MARTTRMTEYQKSLYEQFKDQFNTPYWMDYRDNGVLRCKWGPRIGIETLADRLGLKWEVSKQGITYGMINVWFPPSEDFEMKGRKLSTLQKQVSEKISTWFKENVSTAIWREKLKGQPHKIEILKKDKTAKLSWYFHFLAFGAEEPKFLKAFTEFVKTLGDYKVRYEKGYSGMQVRPHVVIWVPKGDLPEPSPPPKFYRSSYQIKVFEDLQREMDLDIPPKPQLEPYQRASGILRYLVHTANVLAEEREGDDPDLDYWDRDPAWIEFLNKFHKYVHEVLGGEKVVEVFGSGSRHIPYSSSINIPEFPYTDIKPEWKTGTVIDLCKAIEEEKAFDRMPILADALEEAGCDHTEVLDRLRDPRLRQTTWICDAVNCPNAEEYAKLVGPHFYVPPGTATVNMDGLGSTIEFEDDEDDITDSEIEEQRSMIEAERNGRD